MLKLFLKTSGRTPQLSFPSYEAALSASDGTGYQSSNVVDVVVQKNKIYQDHLQRTRTLGIDTLRLAVGLAAVERKGPTLSVIDFGGGGGTQFFAARSLLGSAENITWNVVETPAMVKAANANLACRGLRFFESIEEAQEDMGVVDLVFASGSLQYTPDPLAMLRRLVSIEAPHLYITRTSFNDQQETMFALQHSRLSHNGPGPLPEGFNDEGVSYPVTFSPKNDAEDVISAKYEIRFAVKEEVGAYRVASRSFDMHGYFCDLKRR